MARKAKIYTDKEPGFTAYHTQALKEIQAGADSIKEVARRMLLSPRMAWAILKDLESAGFVKGKRTKRVNL